MEAEETPKETAGAQDGGPASGGAPDTPPAPRRDPYATFGNPLHDTWGSRSTQNAAPAGPIHVGKRRKKRPAIKWAVTVLVVALLAIGGWFARDAIGDAWDWIYDKAANVTGDSDEDVGPDSPGTTAPATGPDSDEFRQAADANAASFDDWMDANHDPVAAAVDELEAISRDITAQASDISNVNPPEYRAALVNFRESILGVVHTLDDAPKSAIRDDFVKILLVQLDGTNQIIEAFDAGDGAGIQRAGKDLQNAGTETMRLCRQYGKRAEALCE